VAKAIFKGDTYLFTNQYTATSTMLEQNKEYDIEWYYDGPQVMVNGHAIVHPEGTIWVKVGGCEVPFTPECFKRQWEVLQ
jgi:hypothetical protein